MSCRAGAGVCPGPVPEGAEILVSQTPDAGWELELDGRVVPRRVAVGWASAYLPPSGGEASLTYTTPWWRNSAQVAQIIVLAVLTAGWLRRRIGRTA